MMVSNGRRRDAGMSPVADAGRLSGALRVFLRVAITSRIDHLSGTRGLATHARARCCTSLAALLAALCLLALGAASALAEQRGHVTTPREFGSGLLKEPDGVAVNEATEVVYVADSGHDRVAMFDGSTGTLVGEFNGSGKLERENVKHEKELFEGREAGSGGEPGEEKTGEFSDPTQIAVDNSCEQQRPKLTETSKPKTCKEFDPSYGDVYVLDSGHKVVDKYSATGAYVGQIAAGTLGLNRGEFYALEGVAVEADGDVLVSAETSEAAAATGEGVYRLSDGVHNGMLARSGTPTGFTGTERTVGFVEPGLAAAGGRVFVVQGFAGRVVVYGLDGKLLAGGEVKEGEVVPPLYEGALGGIGGESCSGDVYVDTGTGIDRFEGAGGLVESLPVVDGVEPQGLGVGYGVAADCVSLGVFAANANAGVVDVYGPEPSQAPKVEPGSGFAAEVTSDGAKLSARINPRTEPGEGETTYVFEYGPCPLEGSCAGAQYGHSVTGSVPDEYGPVGVSSSLRGLMAGTRYHYLLSAYNRYDEPPAAPEYGEELTFITQSSFPGGLLDERGWELVTPPDKHGAQIEPIAETGVIQAAADGDALTYLASAPTEANPAGNTNKVQALSVRGENGWASCDLALAHSGATGVSLGEGQEYRAFASDLQAGLAWPLGAFVPGLAPGAREVSPLLAGLSGACEPQSSGTPTQPSYQALLSGCPGEGECEPLVREHADVEAGVEVADESECRAGIVFCAAAPLGANPSLSAVVLRSKSPLLAGASPEALYEWYGGQVYPVSVLPGGSIVGGENTAPRLGSHERSLRGAISEDGSRVVWSESGGGDHLFVWGRSSERSAQVDTVQQQAGGKSGEGRVEPMFQFATADGSKVFFTDTQRLTADAGEAGADLYECEVVIEKTGEETKPKCLLKDLTPPLDGSSADVLGEAIGGSQTGGLVYFVANGVLTKTPSPTGEHALQGDCTGRPNPNTTCNLYMWNEKLSEPVLIAVLSGEDVDDWGGEIESLTRLTARVTNDGEWLAFMSQRSLTGYDNRDAANIAVRDEEVYLYHAPPAGAAGAESSQAAGGLTCVSCNPTGERPHGVEYAKLNQGRAAGAAVWPNKVWLAGSIPAWTPVELGESEQQPRYLDANGRIFFDSSDSLLPRDTNGTEDVYEYEPVGVGSCQAGGGESGQEGSGGSGGENGGGEGSGGEGSGGSEGYVPAEKGCLGLVSSGESGEESGFLDASENGNDVFFLTKSQLSKHDTDTSYDIYDARVGGIEQQESKPVECQGDACQSPVTPPESLTPSSFTFSGAGNQLTPPAPGSTPAVKKVVKKVVRCKKHFVKDKKGRCVRRGKGKKRAKRR